MKKIINVTQPFLPNLDEFIPYLENIWESKILSNSGYFHNELESKLCEYLGVEYISLFSNGTLALITALQSLRITGDVITTPYSFVATGHALLWNGIKPIFVDVSSKNLNIDPAKIEAAITPQTTAIVAVHCYGNPCDVNAIQKIADNYNLKVIYDACHAFGVKDANGSILNYGDLSVLSFHATKVFNTFEGGAIICHDLKTKKRLDNLKNFGFIDEVTIGAPGINGKMSEINASFGLLQLKHMDYVFERRAQIDSKYRSALTGLHGIEILANDPDVIFKNNSYFPILIKNSYKLTRDEVFTKLKNKGINARKYFFPLISDFSMYKAFPSSKIDNLPTAYEASRQVICLPIYPALEDSDVDYIINALIDDSI